MLSLDSRYEANQQEVAAQVIDGEAIMINLSTGVYYSLDKAGSTLWTLVADQFKLSEVAAAIAERYQVGEGQARTDVERLIQELLSENLVRASGATASARSLSVAISDLPAPGQNLAYEGLKLNIYRDMGDLLALDPPMPGLEDIPWKPTGRA